MIAVSNESGDWKVVNGQMRFNIALDTIGTVTSIDAVSGDEIRFFKGDDGSVIV